MKRLPGSKHHARIALLALTVASWSTHAGAAGRDEICDQLQAFEAAPFKLGSDGALVRRWVAFEWKGYFPGDYEDICHHSADEAEKAFCSYLIQNTNQEFRADLPLRILHCYGYAFPRYAEYDWDVSKGHFRLHGRLDDRRLLLNVEALPGEGDSAIWISVVPNNVVEDDKGPPPLNRHTSVAPTGHPPP